jgi:hypothetical protein
MDKFPVINRHTRTFDLRQTGEEEYTAKIIQFRPPALDASDNTAFEIPVKRDDEAGDWRRETEAALKMDGYILLAWVVCSYGGRADIISAWYLPEDGERWVYKWNYDKKTMQAIDSFSRTTCRDTYQWLRERKPGGLFKEIHVCAPPYILLDSKDLRKEYLAGNLEETS